MTVLNDRQPRYHRLDNDLVHLCHQIGVLLILEDRSDQPFVTFLILGVNVEGMVLFVDGVVREMSKLIGKVALTRLFKLFSRKTNYPIFIDKNPQRLNTSNQHINPEVELKSIKQHRVRNILLNYDILLLL